MATLHDIDGLWSIYYKVKAGQSLSEYELAVGVEHVETLTQLLSVLGPCFQSHIKK